MKITASGKEQIVFQIDYKDYLRMRKLKPKFYVSKNAGGNFYVRVWFPKKRAMSLSRYLMCPDKGYVVDHISGDTLDNRRKNLRVCTQQENSRNSKKQKDCSSIYKGVRLLITYKHDRKVWVASINQKYIGVFHNEIDAAIAYDEAAINTYGEFARLNFGDKLLGDVV
jgi:hypothetical protein